MPARIEKSDQVSVGVNDLFFKELNDVVTFFEQSSVGASVGAQAIVHAEIYDKVEDILGAAKN